jgi:hypothetical protein
MGRLARNTLKSPTKSAVAIAGGVLPRASVCDTVVVPYLDFSLVGSSQHLFPHESHVHRLETKFKTLGHNENLTSPPTDIRPLFTGRRVHAMSKGFKRRPAEFLRPLRFAIFSAFQPRRPRPSRAAGLCAFLTLPLLARWGSALPRLRTVDFGGDNRRNCSRSVGAYPREQIRISAAHFWNNC